MRKFRLLSTIVFVCLIISCKHKHSIEANILGLGNDTILLEYRLVSKYYEIEEPIQDTIYSNNDKFFYDNKCKEPILVYIFPKKGEIKRVDGPMYHPSEKSLIVLLMPDDKIQIHGELKDFYLNYFAKGSEYNEQHSLLRQKYIEQGSEAVLVELKLDSLMAKNGDEGLINGLFKKRNEIYSRANRKKLEYIKSNLNKELSAYYLTGQPLDTLGKYYKDLAPQISQGIFKNMLENKFTKYLKYIKVREAEKIIQEGKVAPDFTLKSISGVDFSLNSISNRYVVLDFWGSWCAPCVTGFPKMKQYYIKYKNQVEFIGIACNDSENSWKKSVQENQLDWIQLINNEAINFDVSIRYGIKGFPTKLILNKDKLIIAIFSGEGDDFYNKMDELMTK